MQLATIRINDTEVLSVRCPRIDAKSGPRLLRLVSSSVEGGARSVVLDLGPSTVVDFAGARALQAAGEKLGPAGRLYLAGLNGRARAMLRSLNVDRHVHMVEWWTDAVEPTLQQAA